MNPKPTFIELPSAPMQTIYRTIQKVVRSNIPILITGETGVGKEGIARYIHKSGPRRDKPFIAINCGRFSPELLQSELFGHEAGAFTGAIRQRQGTFEIADGGVLLLDKVPEMPMDAQKMFLRVLDTATFTRLGGNEAVTVDVQVIATTNKDILRVVAEKEFREDLYYRLKGLMFHIPPLRERPEDIAPLVAAFINEFNAEYGKSVTAITAETLKGLKQAVWHGNIRELRSTIQTAIALATTDKIELKDLPDIHPELIQKLITIWQTLPSEIQRTVIHELSTLLPESEYSLQVSSTLKIDEEYEDFLNIKDMNQSQILRAVAQKRIKQYPTHKAAAESLAIDTRTLRKYTKWKK